MAKFSIDYINNTSFFNKLDYSNKVILNSVADPLFIYDKEKNEYVCHACEKYYINKLKVTLHLRNDLYFYDGTKVTALDYVNSIKNGISLLPIMSNIKEIYCKNNVIYITLKYNNNDIIKFLSCYFLAPHDGKTSGKYYIYKTFDNKIIFKPNVFYRNKALSDLEFIKYDNFTDNYNAFENKKVDISNNTFIPLNFNNKNNEKSGIIISLEVSTRYNINERKKIINSINKSELAYNLGNAFYLKNDFFYYRNKKYKYKRVENFDKTKLRLFYNEFYPNYKIASFIKKDLQKNNYDVELIKIKYKDFILLKDYDLKLTLNYFEYIDDLFFYKSNYFNYIMKEKSFYRFCITKNILHSYINSSFKKKFIKEPLLSYYSNYKFNDKTDNFSYLECNYDKITD